MKEDRCVVEVGTHPGPFWVDQLTGMKVCDRHRHQYETSYDDYGPFEWERA